MRIFIGVALPLSLQKQLKKLLKVLERKHWPVKWEAIEKLHFTLVFLGEIPESKIVIVKEIVREICQQLPSFSLEIKGLGCFPDYLFPKIIWLGLKGDLKSLSFLQKQLKLKLKDQGFVIDNRPFLGHVTLGRVKKAKMKQLQEIGRQLKALREMEIGVEWHVKEVIIFQSQILSQRSKYYKVAEILLKNQNYKEEKWQISMLK
ncbi:2'-5' RNA ligase [Candidatus Beckwithbacteria bacterium RBG_13_42_9]|uniref:RNA 2',3'-cyclic phosphodiesterase n=1 Tax=Candidatus Beckwithbacteria bacterium RBG_13_42_9 TaxID=1797457 RepID=A0A1F5E6T0_9BACT|nr:MAG: 2'-5' RNA ligase [Candidatus Beckwithbacteria bacterium RBG_13_42_9]